MDGGEESIEDLFAENPRDDPHTIIPATHLGQWLVQSPIRLIQLNAPKPVSDEHGHWKVDQLRDGDQVIRIETFYDRIETFYDPVTDEIRRWSSVSEDKCQQFVCVEDGVLDEFEMM